MGADKATLELGGRTLLSHVIFRLEPQVAAVVVNANRHDGGVIPDSVPGFPGPLAGVLAGLDWAAAQGHADIVTAPVDMPFLPLDLVARLRQVRTNAAPIACASSAGRLHPVACLWPVAIRETLRTALGDGVRKVGGFATSVGLATAEWPADPHDPFFNVNTPEDLEAAERLLA